MPILRMEHSVPDYDAWKRAFDNDPLGRRQSGVIRYRIFRVADDRNRVLVDLEFDSAAEAEAMADRLKAMWRRVQAQGLIDEPQLRVVELAESREY